MLSNSSRVPLPRSRRKEVLPGKFLQRQDLVGTETAVVGTDDHQGVAHVFLRPDGRAAGMALHQGKVDGVFQQFFLQELGGLDGRLHRYPGMEPTEGLDVIGQKLRPDGDAGPHPQQSELVAVPQLPLHVLKQGGNVHGVLPETGAGLGQDQPPPDAVEQDHTVVFLQLPDGQTDCGLRQMQMLRSAGGVAIMIAHRQKNPDMTYGHGFSPYYNKNNIKPIK